MKEYKIGEQFYNDEGVLLKVCAGNGCDKCYYYTFDCRKPEELECSRYLRKSYDNVYFKEVEIDKIIISTEDVKKIIDAIEGETEDSEGAKEG